jgi:hypothetical protein
VQIYSSFFKKDHAQVLDANGAVTRTITYGLQLIS